MSGPLHIGIGESTAAPVAAPPHTRETNPMLHENNLAQSVEQFLTLAAQPTDGSSPKAIGLYVGLVIEEGFIELMEAMGLGHSPCVEQARQLASNFKGDQMRNHILQANPVKVLDSTMDTGWVALALGKTLGADLDGAVGELTRSNLIDKLFPDGRLHRDRNGKVVKPPNWSEPNFAAFLPHRPAPLEGEQPSVANELT